MSDTIIFGKKFQGHQKSAWLYVVNAFCLTAGLAFLDLSWDKWQGWWALQKVGFFLLVIGNCTNTLKAATSSSTRKPEVTP